MSSAACRPRVVILGGGFAGLYAALYLQQSELVDRGATVTLIDRRSYFTFQPLLAEVVAGRLGRDHVTYPFRGLARRYGFRFVRDRIVGVDLERRRVRLERGVEPYDHLLLGLGAEPSLPGNAELDNVALPLTTVGEAIAIRHRVLAAQERAASTGSAVERRRLQTVLVAGAGPAGVEVASEVHHLTASALRPFYPQLGPGRVALIDPGARILQGFDERLADEGMAVLQSRGLELRLGSRVTGASPESVRVSRDGADEDMPIGTFIWTAGTAANGLAGRLGLPVERGAVRVTPTLQVEGQTEVFAAGDVAHLVDPRNGRPYPRVAPIAISQGVRAAANIENLALGRSLEPYQAHHAGKIVSLGSGVALVDLLGLRLRGVPAWMVYRAAYLLKLVGGRNKIRVVTDLLLHRMFGPDLTFDDAPVVSDRLLSEVVADAET
jgi:NADH:ubiquinone reductase (H+-translocating)